MEWGKLVGGGGRADPARSREGRAADLRPWPAGDARSGGNRGQARGRDAHGTSRRSLSTTSWTITASMSAGATDRICVPGVRGAVAVDVEGAIRPEAHEHRPDPRPDERSGSRYGLAEGRQPHLGQDLQLAKVRLDEREGLAAAGAEGLTVRIHGHPDPGRHHS